MKMKSDGNGDLNGFLDAGSHMNGELRFEDTFRVDGRLSGKVISKGDLVVGERGEVDAEVHVGRVFVSGVLKGSIHASKKVEVTVGGKLYGEVRTPSLVIEDGAFFQGRSAMGEAASAEKAGSPQDVVRMPISKES